MRRLVAEKFVFDFQGEDLAGRSVFVDPFFAAEFQGGLSWKSDFNFFQEPG